MSEIIGFDYATINSVAVKPLKYPLLYHGTNRESPQIFYANDGLPKRGNDIDLIRHVEPPPSQLTESAFRGTVHYPISPAIISGACFWAGEDGWVYRIVDYPGYDINELLAGKIPDGKGGFRDPLMKGEQEIAIPARVVRIAVTGIGRVVERRRGLSVIWENL